MDAPLPASGGWNLARIADLSLAQAAYQLASEKCVWLPTMSKSDATKLAITTVGQIGEIGPIHRDINGITPQGGKRGPFDTPSIKAGSVPTYPVLWALMPTASERWHSTQIAREFHVAARRLPSVPLLLPKLQAYGKPLRIVTSIAISA